MEYSPPSDYHIEALPRGYNLPLGWKCLQHVNGRIVYHSPPQRVLIRSRSEIEMYHRMGRFLELNPLLPFSLKNSERRKCYTEGNLVHNKAKTLPKRTGIQPEIHLQRHHQKCSKSVIESELDKMTSAVKQLTLEENKVLGTELQISF